MSGMIARPGLSEPRCFPLPGAEPGDGSDGTDADRRAAQGVLTLAERAWTPAQRLLGWRLDDRGRLGRLLHQQQEAVAAEREGRWQRADFFWRQTQGGLKALHGRQRLWEELSGELRLDGAQELAEADGLRRRLIEEVFIDAHCAFYNGRVRDTDADLAPDDRAFDHARHLEALLPLCEWPSAEQAGFLRPTADRQIAAHEGHQNRNQGIRVCRDFLRRFPDDVTIQDRLLGLDVKALEAELSQGESERVALSNAEALQRHIRDLEELRRNTRSNLHVYQVLGQLHCQRAVCLANGSRLAEALEMAERGTACNPLASGATELRDQLSEAMHNLQRQVHLLEQEVARRPGAQLNATGLALRKQARRGFSGSERFAASAKAVEIRKGFERAVERAVETAADTASSPSPSYTEPSTPVAVASPASRRRGDREPAFEWLLSRQDLRVKLQGLAAAVLLLLAGTWSWEEGHNRELRDTAYEQILEANAAGEKIAVLQGAEAFLSTPLRGGDDRREQQVLDIYSENLTRWIVEERNVLDEEDRQRIERYRQLGAAASTR